MMKLSFALLAFLILGSAAVALSRRNLIHSALLLIGAWFGIAGYYLWAGAEFVAFAQVLIYGGAVSMVVLFAVLLTRQAYPDVAEAVESRGRTASALLAGLAVFALLVAAGKGLRQEAPASAPTLTVRQLGLHLMGEQAAAVLVVGALLTIALIGAIVLAAGNRAGNRKDAP